ncbi:metallophosphoesterase [Corallococcus sp. AB045]|uniref:metallophosphoesterase family protein n=1 Tax=Corallococcus sp. AB045 TaxID=2316719 RepID=UPI00131559C7|nr:metallophosphoesterase [Corallococcus sp. AB045]
MSLHSNIAREHGFVWWGWWNKGGEQVPSEEFAELRRKARQPGGLTLYLLDSGHSQTYSSVCTDIHWEPGGEPIASPDPEKTPSYYREKKVLAWFKLGPIESHHLETSKYTYVRVDRFFTSQPSKYSAFYNKRIFSTHELTEQNRTIWFMRKARSSDRQHEVSLLDGATLTPEHFPQRFIQSGSRNLLWVSDLHFDTGTDSHHGFSINPKTPARRTLGQAVHGALEKHLIRDLGGMLASGDITWKAAATEFEQALGFFKWMESSTNLTRFQIATCPGNHDLSYSTHREERDAPIDITYPEARKEYAEFYAKLFGLTPNEHLSCGRRFLLGDSYSVDIVCLNSSILQQRPGVFRGHGFVGEDQLRDAANAFGWSSTKGADRRPFRIVMLHHHLVPVTYREQPDPAISYSVTLDAEALMRWAAECQVDLVLHGHMHEASCVKISKPAALSGKLKGWHDFHVIGMGSTGVSRDHQGSTGKNTFGILRFEDHSVIVTIYSVSPTDPSEEIWSVQIPLHRER